MKFQFGVEAQDLITGFTGVITGYASYITGCDQYLVTPRMAKPDGEVKEPRWFDEMRLTVVRDSTPVIVLTKKEAGADIPAPIK